MKSPLNICVEKSVLFRSGHVIEHFSGIAFDMDVDRAKNTPAVFHE
jgi:hypothetical protein